MREQTAELPPSAGTHCARRCCFDWGFARRCRRYFAWRLECSRFQPLRPRPQV